MSVAGTMSTISAGIAAAVALVQSVVEDTAVIGNVVALGVVADVMPFVIVGEIAGLVQNDVMIIAAGTTIVLVTGVAIAGVL